MKKHTAKILYLPSSGYTAVLLILSVSFLIGSVSGNIFAQQLSEGGSEALWTYLDGYLSTVRAGILIKPDFWAVLWDVFRWPLLIFILGITPLGLLGIPILFLIRSFLLSFAIASFYHALGSTGLWMALIMFGLSGLFYIPALFRFGSQCFQCAGELAGRIIGERKKRSIIDRSFLIKCVVCVALFCFCLVIEYSIAPGLIRTFAELLLK